MSIKRFLTLFALLLSPYVTVNAYTYSEQLEQEQRDILRLDRDFFAKAIKQSDAVSIQNIISKHSDKKAEFLREGLCYAAQEKKPQMIRFFLQLGAQVDDSFAGWTALHYAVRAGSVECVTYLLACGADINARTWWCQVTPLFIAVENNNLSMVKLLVEHGARLDMQSYWLHYTVLHEATKINDTEILEYLLSVNASLNIRDKLNQTALMHAALYKNVNAVKIIAAHKPLLTYADIATIEHEWQKHPESQDAARQATIIKILAAIVS